VFVRKPVKKTVPEAVSVIIENILSRSDALHSFQEVRFLKKCIERLGEDFCSHLRPVKFKNGIMYCAVDSPSWIQQYQFLSNEMLKRLQTPPLEFQVTGFRFAVGSIRDADYINKVQTANFPPGSGLSQAEAAELYAAVESLHPELRDDLRNMIQHWTNTDGIRTSQETRDEH